MGTPAPISNLTVEKTSNVEFLKDSASYSVSVSTSSSDLETLIGEALPDNVLGVTVVVGTETIHYNPAGTASASNSHLPAVFTIWGTKAVLDLAEFYAASGVEMGVIVHVPAYTHDAIG